MQDKIKEFLKKNWIIIAILVLAFILRLKSFEEKVSAKNALGNSSIKDSIFSFSTSCVYRLAFLALLFFDCFPRFPLHGIRNHLLTRCRCPSLLLISDFLFYLGGLLPYLGFPDSRLSLRKSYQRL